MLVGAALVSIALGTTGEAHAQASFGQADLLPVEQRLALSIGPLRTTLWTSLRFSAAPGDVALVVPLPTGAAVDASTRAFFEALDESTAPRILPPTNGPQGCPGEDPIEPVVDGDLAASSTLAPLELLVLDDLSAVLDWADLRGLAVPSNVTTSLSLQPAARFLVARFSSVGATSLTPTYRVSTPAGAARFPLVLSRATNEDLRVVLYTLGEGRADLGGTPVAVEPEALRVELEPPSSNYRSLLEEALVQPGTYVVEATSRAALRDFLPAGTGSIRPFADAYYARAAAYGDATSDPDACALNAAAVLGHSGTLGTACPRGDVFVVPGGPTCSVDLNEPGEAAPDLLRCGGIADDFAVALGDLDPSQVWLTRAVQRLGAGTTGADRDVELVPGPRVDPILVASTVDVSGCGGAGEGGAGPGPSGAGPSGSTGSGEPTASSGAGAAGPSYVEVPVRSYEGCGCSGTWVTVDYLLVDAGDEPPPEAYYVEDDGGCSGDTSESFESESYSDEPTAESCTSDTSGIYETESGGAAPADDCGGDSSDGWSDSGGDDCGGDTSDGSSDSGGDDCGGDTSSDGGGDDCAVSTRPGRGPGRARLSVLTFLSLLVIVPLRRITRRRARPRAR